MEAFKVTDIITLFVLGVIIFSAAALFVSYLSDRLDR